MSHYELPTNAQVVDDGFLDDVEKTEKLIINGVDEFEETFEGTFDGFQKSSEEDVEEERETRGEDQVDDETGHSSEELVSHYQLPINSQKIEKLVRPEDEFYEAYEGTFGGFRKSDEEDEEEELSEKELALWHELNEELTARELVLHNKAVGENALSTKLDAIVVVEKTPPTSSADVELDQMDDQSDIEYDHTKKQTAEDSKERFSSEIRPSSQLPEESSNQNAATSKHITYITSLPQLPGGQPKPDASDDEAPTSNRQRRTTLGMCAGIIILLCVILALLVVMIITKNENDDESNLRGGDVVGGETTNIPSFAPTSSLSPTASSNATEVLVSVSKPMGTLTCPPNVTMFELTVQLGEYPSEVSWAIYDKCTLDFFYRCTQCYTDSPTNYPISFSGCLPSFYGETKSARGFVLQMNNMAESPSFGYSMNYGSETIFDADMGSFTMLQLDDFGGLSSSCAEALGQTPEVSERKCGISIFLFQYDELIVVHNIPIGHSPRWNHQSAFNLHRIRLKAQVYR